MSSVALAPVDVDVKFSMDAQQTLVRDEAIAHWSAINRIREALTAKAVEDIMKGGDGLRFVRVLNELSLRENIAEEVLRKLI